MVAAPHGLSFVVCTHNGAGRLVPTLSHLAAQTGLDTASWEVVLVDNASTDDSGKVAEVEWARRGGSADLRVIHEPVPGLIHARKAGIAAARFPIICFVDDDNWICPDWASRVLAIFDANSEVGLIGGCGEAVFDDPADRPSWFQLYQHGYAVGPQAAVSGRLAPGGMLYGAGLSVRKAALEGLFARGFTPFLTGRQGGHLTAGDDSELCLALALDGWGMWYDEKLTFRHHMPAGRLNENYLARMYAGFGFASPKIDLYLMMARLGRVPPAWFMVSVMSLKWAWAVVAASRAYLRIRRKSAVEGEKLAGTIKLAYTKARMAGLVTTSRQIGDLIDQAMRWRDQPAPNLREAA